MPDETLPPKDGSGGDTKLSKNQKKRLKEKAKKQQKESSPEPVESPPSETIRAPLPTPSPPSPPLPPLDGDIEYVNYEDERQLPAIMELLDKDLSEPYSIFTYRFFVHNWPQLCVCAMLKGELVGVIVCKAERELDGLGMEAYCGYIAMLAVDSKCRRRGVGSNLIKESLIRMRDMKCDQAMLETEVGNAAALKLYERLGFLRDERLSRYYLNGSDAYRLRLWFEHREEPALQTQTIEEEPSKNDQIEGQQPESEPTNE